MKTLGLLVLAVACAANLAYAGDTCCKCCGSESAGTPVQGTKIKAGQCATCQIEIPEGKGVAVTDADGNTLVYCEMCAQKASVPVEVTSN